MDQNLTASEVIAILNEAGIDLSQLTISDDHAVWTDVFGGTTGTSVRIDGPKKARKDAGRALYNAGFGNAPYPDRDYWSR